MKELWLFIDKGVQIKETGVRLRGTLRATTPKEGVKKSTKRKSYVGRYLARAFVPEPYTDGVLISRFATLEEKASPYICFSTYNSTL